MTTPEHALVALVRGLETKLIAALGNSHYSRRTLLANLDEIITELLISADAVDPPKPLPAQCHVRLGSEVTSEIICDKRQWMSWRRIEGQTYVELSSLIDQEDGVPKIDPKADYCGACLLELGRIAKEIRSWKKV